MSPTKEGQSHHTKNPGKVTELLQPTGGPLQVGIPSKVPSLAFHKALPVLAFNPWGQELPELHGEAVTVELVELLQVPRVELL